MLEKRRQRAEKVAKWREDKKNKAENVTGYIDPCNRNVQVSNLQEQEQELKKKDSLSESPKKKAAQRFCKPTQEEVFAYCRERGNDVDPEQFWNFYEAKGWKVGTASMKNWQACVRTWEKGQNANSRNNGKSGDRHVSASERARRAQAELDAERRAAKIHPQACGQDER